MIVLHDSFHCFNDGRGSRHYNYKWQQVSAGLHDQRYTVLTPKTAGDPRGI